MERKIAFLWGVVMIIITLMFALPNTVDAAIVQKNLYASGNNNGIGNPPVTVLTRTLPSTPTTVNVASDGLDDVEAIVDLDLNVNNAGLGASDYTDMVWKVQYFQINTSVLLHQ